MTGCESYFFGTSAREIPILAHDVMFEIGTLQRAQSLYIALARIARQDGFTEVSLTLLIRLEK
jgi:hypothetical protein